MIPSLDQKAAGPSTPVRVPAGATAPEVALIAASRRAALVSRWSGALFGVLGVALVLAAWQICAVTGVVDINISSDPSQVISTEVQLFSQGTILSPLGTTATEVAWGLLLIIVIGIPTGMLLGRVKFLRQMADPVISVLNSVPYVLFLPLIIFWFGLGTQARVLVVLWAGVLPLVINTSTGVRNIDRDYLRVGQAYMFTRWRFFKSILLPAAMPYILAGMRLAVARALVGAIVVEFFLGAHGLGFFVQNATSNFQMSAAMAGITVMAVSAVALIRLIGIVEKRTLAWSHSQ